MLVSLVWVHRYTDIVPLKVVARKASIHCRLFSECEGRGDVLIKTIHGQIEGLPVDGGTAYLGIRFGEPPVD